MEENNKYYTPRIEDIRVGYEYEELTYNPQDDISISEPIWEKRKFPDPFTGGNILKLENRNIRIPYLSKEDIESEGWVLYETTEKSFRFIKSLGEEEYKLFFPQTKAVKDCNITIYNDTQCPHCPILFHGKILSINEFRYITKELLSIK